MQNSLNQVNAGNISAKTIQKPPRGASAVSSKLKSPVSAQQSTRNIDAYQNLDYQQDAMTSDNRTSANSTNAFQNFVSPHSAVEYYEQLNQSQQQQFNNYDSYPAVHNNMKETVKYEAASAYSTVPATQRLNYSEIMNNSISQNDQEHLKPRTADAIKSDHSTQQLLQTPISNNQQRRHDSFTPVTNTNDSQLRDSYSRTPFNHEVHSRTPMMSESNSKTPVIADNYFQNPERLQNSLMKKKTSPSPIAHRQTANNNLKLSAKGIQQRINQLKDSKDTGNNQNNTSKNSSPKKSEIINSVRISEPEQHSIAYDTKKAEKIIITPVTDETKERIISWLYSITLIKENIKDIDKKLPKICKDGVIFIDLINRLEGKHETIKGAVRKPDTKTQIVANYLKLMTFLKRFERMNARYIFAQDYLMEGNEDVFWGLLDDIWHLYNKKVSPYDVKYGKDDKKSSARLRNSMSESVNNGDKTRRNQFEVSYNDICYHDRSKLNISHVNHSMRSKSPSERETFDTKTQGDYRDGHPSARDRRHDQGHQFHSENSIEVVLDEHRNQKHEQDKGNPNESYYNLYSKRNGQLQRGSHRPTKSIIKKDSSKFISQSLYENDTTEENVTSSIANGISLEGENQVFEWLKTLGFKALLMRQGTSLFEDPFRNGTLIAYVIGRVENERMHSLYKEPKSIDECRHNVYQAFQTLAKRQTPIPSYLKGKEEAVLKGDRNIILALLYSLMKIQETRADLNTSVMTTGEKMYKQEASMYIPPYDDTERELLEKSLIIWLNSLGVFSDASTKPASFRELAILMKNGVLLSDITAIIANQRLTTIHRRPTNELQCITNIRRALEHLREKKNMAQRYLWKEREIYKGNKYILLGLLEDLHRFFDGLPPRSNPNYFLEGPYIPNVEDIEQNASEYNKSISTTKRDTLDVKSRIQSQTNMSVYSSGKDPQNTSVYQVKKTGKEENSRADDTNRSKIRDHTSRLNLSADEPISIIDYERKNLRASFYSPTKQMNENLLSSQASRWENGNDNSSIFRSPRSEIRKFVQLDKPNYVGSQPVRVLCVLHHIY